MLQKTDKIWDKTKRTMQSNQKINNLLTDVSDKLSNIKLDEYFSGKAFESIKLLISMVTDFATGSYRSFSNKTIFMFVFGLVYFLTPIDLIPDFIPVLGFTDDISIIAYLLKSFAEDITNYKEWKTANK